MNKIVKIHLHDLLTSARATSEMLTAACRRQHAMRVVGCCQTGDELLITLEPIPYPNPAHYVFAPFPSTNQDSVIAEINSRYYAGFATIAGFPVPDQMWGLFEFASEEEAARRREAVPHE